MLHVTSRLRWIVVPCVGLAVAAGSWANSQQSQTTASPGTSPQSVPEEVAHAESLSSAFRYASETVLPAVVRITAKTKARQVMRSQPEGTDPFGGRNPFEGTPFEDFFNNDFGGRLGPSVIPEQQGLGSGVIIDSSGLVLTNHHVVDGADEVRVILADGRELEATDIRSDNLTDIAILRIEDSEPFPAAQLGDSDQLQIGDWVLAIGQPFGVGVSVSAGIISGKERTLSEVQRASFLQTDAAVNPGNSGGPLVNLRGEVVGINTAIATRSGGYQGISFAVPVNTAKWVLDQLKSSGNVNRAYLGVGVNELTRDLIARLELPRDTKGVYISYIQDDGPAAQAGVKLQDVILSIDDHPIDSSKELQRTIERLPIGSEHTIVVLRDGKQKSLKVKLDSYNKLVAGAQSRPSTEREPLMQQDVGLQIEDLRPDAAEQLGLEGRQGALVTGVTPQGIAARAGLRTGMLIVRAGKADITSVKDLQKVLDEADLDRGIFVQVVLPPTTGQSGTEVILLKRS